MIKLKYVNQLLLTFGLLAFVSKFYRIQQHKLILYYLEQYWHHCNNIVSPEEKKIFWKKLKIKKHFHWIEFFYTTVSWSLFPSATSHWYKVPSSAQETKNWSSLDQVIDVTFPSCPIKSTRFRKSTLKTFQNILRKDLFTFLHECDEFERKIKISRMINERMFCLLILFTYLLRAHPNLFASHWSKN